MSKSNIGGSSKPQYVFESNLSKLNHPTQEQKEAVDALIKNRFACRYFLDKPIDKATIDEIIDVARFAPSGNNMQPWQVYCIAGSVKDTISTEMIKAHEETPEAYHADYDYYPPSSTTPPAFAERRRENGKIFYTALGVDRNDMVARARVSMRNYEFFNAPVAFIFTIHKDLTQGSWMDVGYFIQGMTIAARARGLETISQESPAKYQRILRKHLPISEDAIVMCGMSIGYPDPEKIALYSAKQPKREVGDIIEYFGI